MRCIVSSAAWIASAALHVTGFGVMAFGPRAEIAAPPAAIVELTVATVAPPPPLPPEAPPPPTPLRVAAPLVKARAATTSPTRAVPTAAPLANAAPPAVDSPLDLTGTTLTSERGDFAVGSGSGGGGGVAAAPPARAPSRAAPASTGPAIVRPEDLSRLPAPPELSGALLAHYPARARALGETGRATLSLIVYQDGAVGGIEVRSATSEEFARACRETLLASRWAPPLSKDGRSVATRVGYTCHFDVR
ncbi:MAG: TonB family protein [Polyangiaceae bacterium]